MLRTALLCFALCILGIGCLLLLVQPVNAAPTLVFGSVLTLCVVFERWRYKPGVSAQAARGQPTGERFVDPQTGALTEVYYDPATGERSYVQVKKATPPGAG